MILIAEAIHDAQRLKELQALPLERKIQITQTRIIEWYQHYHGQVCVSFSGGKDSTVLLHIARKIYPDIPAVFNNTGLEYPEIQKFVKSFDKVDIVAPTMRFDEVISTYGYPLIGKEVGEAIYYARRIKTQPTTAEREKRDDTRQANGTAWQTDDLIETSGARNRGTVLQGKMGGKHTGSVWKSRVDETELTSATDAEKEGTCRSQKSRGNTDWHDWRRGCL